MSRIGKQPVTLPSNTTVTESNGVVEITGPKGSLSVGMLAGVSLSQENGTVEVTAASEDHRQYQGLVRTLLQNAVTGVNEGWKKDLELHGVGMRAAVNGTNLNLNLGFSHPVVIPAPEGISFQVTKNVVSISGIDKQLVGETAAQIRRLRKPEPYKGKGIRYANEYIRRKAGKTGKAGK